MSRITTSYAIWASLAVLVLYGLAFFFLGRDVAKMGADLLVLFGASYLSASIFPAVLTAIRDGVRRGGDRLLVSFWLVWFVIVVQRMWLIISSLSGDPRLAELPVGGAIAVSIAIAAGYGIGAQLTSPPTMGKEEKFIMKVSLFIAGALVGAVVTAYALKSEAQAAEWCVSSRGLVHGPDSPYRGMVSKDRCFSSEPVNAR